MDNSTQGTLYLIPSFLNETATAGQILPAAEIELVKPLTHFIVENDKTARKFLKLIEIDSPQSELTLMNMGKFADEKDFSSYLQPLKKGISVGVISEAGCPGVADPGAKIVALAHKFGIRVHPLVGPSSILMALMASGFNGQSFAFVGYLPIEAGAKAKELKRLETLAAKYKQTQLFIEAPYRNNKLIESIVAACNPQTLLSVAADISGPTEKIITQSIAQWKKSKYDFHKIPAVFSLFVP